MNILLVEDDYLLGRSTARLLERQGQHWVRLTHKAADVFKCCESGGIDIVVMDVHLPGTLWQNKEVTGVDLSRMLKQQPTTAHLPVVLLTGRSTTQADCIRLRQEAIADALVTKPIDDSEAFLSLLDRVQTDNGCHGLNASAS